MDRVHHLVDGLAARGHDVTLVAAGRPHPSVRSVASYDIPPSLRLGEAFPEVMHAAVAARVLDGLDVDVVHDHSLAGPLLAFGARSPRC